MGKVPAWLAGGHRFEFCSKTAQPSLICTEACFRQRAAYNVNIHTNQRTRAGTPSACTPPWKCFRGGPILVFFVMKRILKNLQHMCLCMCGAGMHLRCTNNKPTNKFCNTIINGHANIFHHEKYPLYVLYACAHCILNLTCNSHIYSTKASH